MEQDSGRHTGRLRSLTVLIAQPDGRVQRHCREFGGFWRDCRSLAAGLAVLARKGNSIIRFILCECANAARMTKSALASKYRSLMVRKSHKKAIIAVAHKMIRLIFVLLSRRQPYIDKDIDYAAMSAKKNAPRWIKQLTRIGRWPSSKPAAASA